MSVPVFLTLAAVVCSSLASTDNTTSFRESRRGDRTLGFIDCLSQVRGRSSSTSFLSTFTDDEKRDNFLGKAIGCAKVPLMRSLRMVQESPMGGIELWNGAVEIYRKENYHSARELFESPSSAEVHKTSRSHTAENNPLRRSLQEEDGLMAVHDLIAQLDRVSRQYTMDVEVYPGVKARLSRDDNNDEAVNLSFKLPGLAEIAKRQLSGGDEEEEMEYEDNDQRKESRDITDYIMEDRHGHKKKKVIKGLKKLQKKLAPYLPLLAIPLILQLLMLPLYITSLKIMALKSIMLGKLTLILVAFNIIRNVSQRQMEDHHNSRIAAEYYGFSDGIEYGQWVNRRRDFAGHRRRR